MPQYVEWLPRQISTSFNHLLKILTFSNVFVGGPMTPENLYHHYIHLMTVLLQVPVMGGFNWHRTCVLQEAADSWAGSYYHALEQIFFFLNGAYAGESLIGSSSCLLLTLFNCPDHFTWDGSRSQKALTEDCKLKFMQNKDERIPLFHSFCVWCCCCCFGLPLFYVTEPKENF